MWCVLGCLLKAHGRRRPTQSCRPAECRSRGPARSLQSISAVSRSGRHHDLMLPCCPLPDPARRGIKSCTPHHNRYVGLMPCGSGGHAAIDNKRRRPGAKLPLAGSWPTPTAARTRRVPRPPWTALRCLPAAHHAAQVPGWPEGASQTTMHSLLFIVLDLHHRKLVGENNTGRASDTLFRKTGQNF